MYGTNQYINTESLNEDLNMNHNKATDFMLECLSDREVSENDFPSMESITMHEDCTWFDYCRKVSGEDLISMHAYVNQLPYDVAAVQLAEWATIKYQKLELD